MKSAAALLNACAALAMVANLAQARQMHAGIDYARYLQETDAVEDELNDWMSKYQDDAATNGWLPASEERDADAVKEDRKQRFFMAKQLVAELKEQNPDAEFSTNSPFSLMTTDEFSTYIKNSYIAGGGRQLRAEHRQYPANDQVAGDSDSSNAASSGNSDGNGRAHSYNFREAFAKYWGNSKKGGSQPGTETVSGTSGSAATESFSFQDLIDWINSNYSPGSQPNSQPNSKPNTRPSRQPSSRAPVVAPTSAPAPVVAPTSAPAPVVAPTSAPAPVVAPTKRPAPVVAPTSRPSPVGPVAPVVAPTSAPGSTPAAATDEEGVIGADGSGIDWSTNKCMPPVQNQGQCGSCWSFATVAGVETGKCIATKATSFVKLSEQNLATCDTRNMGCNGGATSYAFQYVQKNGVCTAADVPYTMSNGRTGTCNSGCAKVASGIKTTPRVTGESGLVSTLNTHPVVIAVAAGNNAWKQYVSGVLSSCQTSQVDHAVLAVGYDASTIKIRNSWGASWGEKGYVRIKRGGSGNGVCSMYTDMIHATF